MRGSTNPVAQLTLPSPTSHMGRVGFYMDYLTIRKDLKILHQPVSSIVLPVRCIPLNSNFFQHVVLVIIISITVKYRTFKSS